jgi:hypothetical protein
MDTSALSVPARLAAGILMKAVARPLHGSS